MAFVGIPLQICPFPLFDVQVRWFVRVLLGDRPLPAPAEMKEDTAREMRRLVDEMNIPEKHFHRFGRRQWPYNAEVARLSGEGRREHRQLHKAPRKELPQTG